MLLRQTVVLFAALGILGSSSLYGEEIKGLISSVEGKVFTIATDSELLPAAGDKVEIFVEIPGVGKAQVGVATIMMVEGTTITAMVESSSGRVIVGQHVAIESPKPTRRPGNSVPILIGRSAEDAKKVVSEAGFRAKFEVGIPAPPNVRPFTVYAQRPGPNEMFTSGGELVITLYAESNSASPVDAPQTADAPTAPPSMSRVPTKYAVTYQLKGPTDESRQLARLIADVTAKYHVSGHPIDAEISERMFDLFIRAFDTQKMYFYQSDIDEFQRDKARWGSMYKAGDIDFLYRVFERFLTRLGERVSVAVELVDIQHDFSKNEELVTDYDMRKYPRNEQEARELWRKRVKYDLLVEKAGGATMDEAKLTLRNRYSATVDRYKKVGDEQFLDIALEILPKAYDPQSAYISAGKWDDFVIQNKQQLVGIGVALQQTDGGARATTIIAGGPAHRDGRLKAGDRIAGVGQGGNGSLVDITDLPLPDIVALIRGPAGTTVRLQVVPDGSFESNVYEITRAKFDLAKARGAILSAELLPKGRQAKLGIIHLPSFYQDLQASADDTTARSASADVRRILESFSAEGVEIAVLDLRSNSGGGLRESLNVASLFIDKGPLLQTKVRDGKIESYDDSENGMVWDKPLVVLTSILTSGGSEILAGACQDYGRALIVGDSRTHGFGTVQDLFDLGNEQFQIANPPSLGRLKITAARFYRPSGKSTQVNGVAPEIVLPTMTDLMDFREEDQRYALQFNQIASADFQTVEFGINERLVTSLRRQSAARRAASPYFQELEERIAAYRRLKQQKSVSLREAVFLPSRQATQSDAETAPSLPEIPDLKLDAHLSEALNVALDYLARKTYFDAEADRTAGRTSAAIAKYKAAVACDPDYVAGHYKLAWTLATGSVRDGQLAVTHAKRAIALDHSQSWAYGLCLAVALAEAGDFVPAQSQLAQALHKASEPDRNTYRFLEQRFANKLAYPR